MTDMQPKDRAITPGQKRAVIERLYACWLQVPEQRFGQMIGNAISKYPHQAGSGFNVEDRILARVVEEFIGALVNSESSITNTKTSDAPPCKHCGGDFIKDHTHIFHGEDVCDNGSENYEPMEAPAPVKTVAAEPHDGSYGNFTPQDWDGISTAPWDRVNKHFGTPVSKPKEHNNEWFDRQFLSPKFREGYEAELRTDWIREERERFETRLAAACDRVEQRFPKDVWEFVHNAFCFPDLLPSTSVTKKQTIVNTPDGIRVADGSVPMPSCEPATPFVPHEGDTSGDLRQVDHLDEIGELGRQAGIRLRNLLATPSYNYPVGRVCHVCNCTIGSLHQSCGGGGSCADHVVNSYMDTLGDVLNTELDVEEAVMESSSASEW